jgi:hypothetical protein
MWRGHVLLCFVYLMLHNDWIGLLHKLVHQTMACRQMMKLAGRASQSCSLGLMERL